MQNFKTYIIISIIFFFGCSSNNDCELVVSEIKRLGLIEELNNDFKTIIGTKTHDRFLKSVKRLDYNKKDEPFNFDSWDVDVYNLSIDSISVRLIAKKDSLYIVYRFMSGFNLNVYPYRSSSKGGIFIIRCKEERNYNYSCADGKIEREELAQGFCIQELTIKIPKKLLKNKKILLFEPFSDKSYFYFTSEIDLNETN